MLYILDYGAGNVASLGELSAAAMYSSSHADLFSARRVERIPVANSVRALGFEFKWVETVEDFDKADVSAVALPRKAAEAGRAGAESSGRRGAVRRLAVLTTYRVAC